MKRTLAAADIALIGAVGCSVEVEEPWVAEYKAHLNELDEANVLEDAKPAAIGLLICGTLEDGGEMGRMSDIWWDRYHEADVFIDAVLATAQLCPEYEPEIMTWAKA